MKKNNIVVILLALGILLISTGCSASEQPATESTQSAAEVTATEPDSTAEDATGKTFTLEELAAYDGQDGNPAYIAVDGVVYDVSNVPEWANGEHWGQYFAGNDLTEEIKNESPHGVSKLEGLPVVGTLAV